MILQLVDTYHGHSVGCEAFCLTRQHEGLRMTVNNFLERGSGRFLVYFTFDYHIALSDVGIES